MGGEQLGGGVGGRGFVEGKHVRMGEGGWGCAEQVSAGKGRGGITTVP